MPGPTGVPVSRRDLAENVEANCERRERQLLKKRRARPTEMRVVPMRLRKITGYPGGDKGRTPDIDRPSP